MTNPLTQIKDRRKPWQKKLQTLKLAKCGTMLAETARAHGSATTAADRELNMARYGRDYVRAPSPREMQYYLIMTTGDAPHHANLPTHIARDCADWLKARGLVA